MEARCIEAVSEWERPKGSMFMNCNVQVRVEIKFNSEVDGRGLW